MSKVFQLQVDDGIGVVTFNVVGDAMNTWTEAAFTSFDELMGELPKATGLKGIIFISGKPDNFFAGANLKMIADIETPAAVREVLELFHGAFRKLNDLNLPVLAAITVTVSAAAWSSPWPARPGSPKRGKLPSSACRSATSASFPAAAAPSACPG